MSELISVVIPAYNEQAGLSRTVKTVVPFLNSQRDFRYEIIIADNGSADGTLGIATELASEHQNVRVLHLQEKGRGRAVKAAWNQSRATVLCYMDVDLSSDLSSLPNLVLPLMTGTHDLATGSRLLNPSLTQRSFKREVISRLYNALVKLLFRTQFSDAQCGFKAITQEAAKELLPRVKHNGWFMDTELLVLGERMGYRVLDLPVRWTEAPGSHVRICRTAYEELKGLFQLRRRLTTEACSAKKLRRHGMAEDHAVLPKNPAESPRR